MKKRLLAVVLVLMLACSMFAGCGGNKEVLKLYITGEYLGEKTIKNFEKQYNAKVIIEYFDSNETMYTKLSAGDIYDVVIPSDYSIERLMKEDYLMPIDKSKITNFKYLADEVLNLEFDPNNDYSIPYLWGSVGIVYNTKNVDYADLENDGYAIFKNTKYKGKIYMYDSERDSFMIAMKNLGFSMNTENEAEVMAAYEWLTEVNKTMSPVYVTDEVIDNMMNGMKDLAVVYSGDAATIISENPDMSYYMPKEGTNMWCDSMVIPKEAPNPELAHKFIDYMLSYEAATDTAVTVGYASPHKQVLTELTAPDGDFYGNVAYYPVTRANDEVFKDSTYLRQKLAELWIKVKADK